MPGSVAPVTLSYLREIGSRFALIDVREHGEYNQAHIPDSSPMPRRLLEMRLPFLVPGRDVQIIFCDDRGPRARLAARTAERMGYERVAVLEGGVNAWASEGYPTEWGMNVPSKDFGERVEIDHHVAMIDAADLHRRVRDGERVLILDTRTPEEYAQYCIPGGRSMPGGELALRITDTLAAEPEPPDLVVVNCAGRTRSIIGTRVLQRMGMPDVVGLKNGTSGWLLAGLELEQGATRTELPEPSADGRATAEAFARRVADEDGVEPLSVDALAQWLDRRDGECLYLIDVRTEAEYRAGHIAGSWWIPGGQAVQRSDEAVAVHDAPIVFICDRHARSQITASWFRQMGFPHVYALDGGIEAWEAAGRALDSGDPAPPVPPVALPEPRRITAADLHASLAGDAAPLVIFVDTSREFARGHVPGARWLSRSWLDLRIDALAPERDTAIVVTDRTGDQAAYAAATLADLGYRDVAILDGGMRAWHEAALPLETGLSGIMDPPEDIVPAGPERSFADMVHYLRWEAELGERYVARRETGAG